MKGRLGYELAECCEQSFWYHELMNDVVLCFELMLEFLDFIATWGCRENP
jgi:hypothetical protein